MDLFGLPRGLFCADVRPFAFKLRGVFSGLYEKKFKEDPHKKIQIGVISVCGLVCFSMAIHVVSP